MLKARTITFNDGIELCSIGIHDTFSCTHSFYACVTGTLISLCIATQTTSTTSQRVLLASLGQTRVVASGAHDASLRFTRDAANTHIDVILAAIVAIAFTHGVERRASDATRDAVHLTQLSLGLRRRDVLGEAPGAHQRHA